MTFLKRAHWNECGGRITFCDKTDVGAVMLLRIMFRCGAVCISTGLPCMNTFLNKPYSIPTWEKFWRAGSSVTWLLLKSGRVLYILIPACDVLYCVEPRMKLPRSIFWCGHRFVEPIASWRTSSEHKVSIPSPFGSQHVYEQVVTEAEKKWRWHCRRLSY